MKPTISVITLGVDDLVRAASFYQALLDLPEDQVVPGDDHIAFFLEGGLSLVLYPRPEIARIARLESAAAGGADLILSHSVRTAEDVDAVLEAAVAAGGTLLKAGDGSEWGYWGNFADPDGHVWEVMASPDA